MTTDTKQLLQVGDKVLFVKSHGEKPVTLTVEKVTKTGRVRVNPELCGCLFAPPTYGDKYEVIGGDRWNRQEIYPYSIEKETELIANAERKKAQQNIEAMRRLKEQKEREDRLSNELAEVKKAYADSVGVFPSPETLPDGTRLYRMTLPVKEEMKERKGGFEIAFVHCKDVEEYDFRLSRETDKEVMTKVVSYASTYIRGVRKGEGWQAPERVTVDSFPSISGGKVASDEEALWETARYLYHSW